MIKVEYLYLNLDNFVVAVKLPLAKKTSSYKVRMNLQGILMNYLFEN